MASKLDRSRPYGTVHGGSGVVVYEQDGKEFDGAGNQVVRAEPAQVQASGQQAGDPGADDGDVGRTFGRTFGLCRGGHRQSALMPRRWM